MNSYTHLLLLMPLLSSILLTAGKDPKNPITPHAPRTVRLDPQERRDRIENQNAPYTNPTDAPQQKRLGRQERESRINSMLAVLLAPAR